MNTEQTVTSKTGVLKIGKSVSDKLPQVKDPSINIRDRLNDVLLLEKHSLVSYQIGINEIINDDLRQLVIKNRDNIQQLHTQCFNELFNLGEYQANAATKSEIADLVEIFKGYQVQLPLQQ
ncbi:spore coat protein [Alkaliphilus peptidifermentans]|uniref:Coat F domain-containing protein n=1 Tax=Alkaliphilus peptidifermentans DSM 18978 TaxID=1120976 RepID=A0A1G5J0L2_9FIRM|nr:spore coat protein [Alkaliphilus peptidifermentans]SCY81501.1 Coat F domain-containing protein [Alkaliphilus peptidifermentans DSM 18978]